MKTGIELEEAVGLMEAAVSPLGTESLPLTAALGRTLAADLTTPLDNPPFDRSPLDGYALRAADIAGASQESPVRLTVVDTVYAGDVAAVPVEQGQCVRIMTGAMLPQGCDCVLMQEKTDMGFPVVEVYQPLKAWDNYCYRGEDYKGEACCSLPEPVWTPPPSAYWPAPDSVRASRSAAAPRQPSSLPATR